MDLFAKKCSVCGERKPLERFRKRKRKTGFFLASYCLVCEREKERRFRQENPELVKRWASETYLRYRERRRRQQNEYARARKKEVKERSRRWYEKNRQLTIRRAKEHGLKDPERRKEQIKASAARRIKERRASRRAWKKKNPLACLIYKQRRRAKKAGAEGKFTKREWLALCELYNHRCLRCGRDDVKLTADHVIPLESGGTNWITNIQPLCGPCNSAKGTKNTDYRIDWHVRAEGLSCERAD